jgi:adenylate cyclase
MSQTRRLAAILAADVAGYSRLIGADEGGTLERLRALRRELLDPKIAEHKGRLVKTTGDGLLVEFGSVVDALRCAVEVQHEMAGRNTGVPPDNRIELRIGINVGDIVVEDGDIFGDGVNVAPRLEALAEPGGICVAARVQEDAAGKLDLAFEDIGEQSLKNIARPVRAFRVVTGMKPMPAPGPPLPDKPSIAVLPFANMSGDPEQEYFADGMVEENTTRYLDPSNSAALTSPARCQVDSLMDCFGLAVHRPLPAGSEVQFLDQTTAACLDNGPVAARSAIRINGTARSSRNSC